MSRVSHELAETYGATKVARMFLQQRHEEDELYQRRFEDAQTIQHELRRWTRDIEIEESIAKTQLVRLREELFELSAQLQTPPDDSNPTASSVISMQPRAAE